jgi:hypothetical protein
LSFIIEKFRLVKKVKIIFWIPACAGMTGKECALIQARFTSSFIPACVGMTGKECALIQARFTSRTFYFKRVLLKERFT